jgi:hypothetical protein
MMVVFPQSNLKNRQELDYSMVGTKFPEKKLTVHLYTVKKYSKIFKSVNVIKA